MYHNKVACFGFQTIINYFASIVILKYNNKPPTLYNLNLQPMESLTYMLNHQRSIYFIYYALSYLLLGQVVTSLGPIIPYLAQSEGRKEIQYSFLLVYRAFGFMSGAFLLKMSGQRFSLHEILCIGSSLLGISSIIFGVIEDLHIKGICIYLQSVGCSFLEVAINLAAIDCFKGDNLSMWLQNIHGCFGVGGLIGPFSVYYFQLFTLNAIGYPWFAIAVIYYYLHTPQNFVDIKKMKQQDSKTQSLPKYSIIYLSLAFLLTVGQEMSYSTWISSYAVLHELSTKQRANLYGSIFWISVTGFRFLFSNVKGSPTTKIKYLGGISIVSTFVCHFFIFNIHGELGLVLMSLLYGLSTSVLFPLLMTIPEEFGYKLTVQQITVFVIWASIGQGSIGLVVGKFMEWFSYNWLLYSMCLMNIGIIALVIANSNILALNNNIAQDLDKQGSNLEPLMAKPETGQYINPNPLQPLAVKS